MKKLLAISLALILLTSNIGLAMVTHYCGGQAVKSQLMIGSNHLDCGMADMNMATEQDPEAIDYTSSGCCENQYQTFEIEDDYQINLSQLSLNLDFVVAFVHSFWNVVLLSETEHPQYTNYSPPLLLRDIPLLHQVFII